jgi:hypothetical protein
MATCSASEPHGRTRTASASSQTTHSQHLADGKRRNASLSFRLLSHSPFPCTYLRLSHISPRLMPSPYLQLRSCRPACRHISCQPCRPLLLSCHRFHTPLYSLPLRLFQILAIAHFSRPPCCASPTDQCSPYTHLRHILHIRLYLYCCIIPFRVQSTRS